MKIAQREIIMSASLGVPSKPVECFKNIVGRYCIVVYHAVNERGQYWIKGRCGSVWCRGKRGSANSVDKFVDKFPGTEFKRLELKEICKCCIETILKDKTYYFEED